MEWLWMNERWLRCGLRSEVLGQARTSRNGRPSVVVVVVVVDVLACTRREEGGKEANLDCIFLMFLLCKTNKCAIL
jgi:hypothetical protein